MGIRITEYLGQRTEGTDNIVPQSSTYNICPFNGEMCKKIERNLKPVCSIRNLGRKKELSEQELKDTPFWIVCPHRLCSTTIHREQKQSEYKLTDYQRKRLRQIAQTIFSKKVKDEEILVKSEASIQVNDDKKQDMHADYVMIFSPDPKVKHPDDSGKRKVIIEMQGGGETGHTGKISNHVDAWETDPTNVSLTGLIEGVGLLQTNAWRRQQEQVLVKSNVASKTKAVDGFVLCIGKTLFDYLEKKLHLTKLNSPTNVDWQVAIISFKEDSSTQDTAGPIPLVVDQVIRIATYSDFISTITSQGKSSEGAFEGVFLDLSNKSYEIEKSL